MTVSSIHLAIPSRGAHSNRPDPVRAKKWATAY